MKSAALALLIGMLGYAPLVAQDPDYAVAKVFVPDLENPPGDRRFRYGRRAVRAMMARA